jgi:hypothetical protein
MDRRYAGIVKKGAVMIQRDAQGQAIIQKCHSQHQLVIPAIQNSRSQVRITADFQAADNVNEIDPH